MNAAVSPLVTKLFATLLLLFGCFGKISVMCSTCKVNEVAARNVSGGSSTECHPCPNCPPGLGLNVLCGSIISNLRSLKCVPCQKGMNYSDTHDYSMCLPCRHCDPNQEKTGECTAEMDEIVCGKCQSGYYMEITGGKCEECSWCCKGNENQRRMQECIQANLPRNRQCAKTALSASCTPKEEPKFPYVKVVVGVAFGVLLILVIFLFVYRRTRQKLQSFFSQLWARSHNRSLRHQHSNGTTNHEFIMDRQGNCVEIENISNASVSASASPNGSSNMHQLPTPCFDRIHSHPGYPITSTNMFGPFLKHIKRLKGAVSNKNGFEKFDNERDDEASSANNSVERSGAANRDYHRSVSLDSRNKQKCLPKENGHISDQPSSACAAVTDKEENLPVAPAKSSHAWRKWIITEHAHKVETELKSLKKSQRFSNNRLCERASTIPFEILSKLCPIMNFPRDCFDDYRMMGEYMGLDILFIKSAGRKTDATKTLLQEFDSRFGGTIGHVMAILNIINRDDAFSILETYCLKPDNS